MLYLEHNGTQVFRVENDPWDDEKFGYSQYHYSIREGAWMDENTFDVRDLPGWRGHGQVAVTFVGLIATDDKATFDNAIREAIDAGMIAQDGLSGFERGGYFGRWMAGLRSHKR